MLENQEKLTKTETLMADMEKELAGYKEQILKVTLMIQSVGGTVKVDTSFLGEVEAKTLLAYMGLIEQAVNEKLLPMRQA